MKREMSIVAVIALAFVLNVGGVAALYGYSNAEISTGSNSAITMNANSKAYVATDTEATVTTNTQSDNSLDLDVDADLDTDIDSDIEFRLSNGLNANIQISEQTAVNIALREVAASECDEDGDECEVELEEMNYNSEIKAVYEVEVEKEARIFGIFKTDVDVEVFVDAETGEVIKVSKPWYAKLTTETSAYASAG